MTAAGSAPQEASTAAAAAGATGQDTAGLASIGSVLDALRADFPEITISKIRFLESEGLISPARTPSGYRQFTPVDVRRLRFVLSAQRDHYLPLKVIRARLAEFDADPSVAEPSLSAPGTPSEPATRAPSATAPAGGGPGAAARPPVAGPTALLPRTGRGSPGPGGPGPGPSGVGAAAVPSPSPSPDRRAAAVPAATTATTESREAWEAAGDGVTDPPGPLTRASLLAEEGVDEALLEALDLHGVLRAEADGTYEPEALDVARTASALAGLGVEPRLLRGLRAGADREVGLLTQLVTPVARHRGADATTNAEALSDQLAVLSGRLHTLLVGAGLRRGLRR